jgi:hypothetical protein
MSLVLCNDLEECGAEVCKTMVIARTTLYHYTKDKLVERRYGKYRLYFYLKRLKPGLFRWDDGQVNNLQKAGFAEVRC